MSTPAFMTIEGTQQGLITKGALTQDSIGSAWQETHKDKIQVQAISHAIVASAGASAGSVRRMHKPLIITKALDKSSPLLNNAVCTGEPLKECRLEMYRSNSTGTLELFYTIDLKDAVITGMDLIMPHCQDPASASYTQFERVHFAYKCISWKHEAGQTIGLDVWSGTEPS